MTAWPLVCKLKKELLEVAWIPRRAAGFGNTSVLGEDFFIFKCPLIAVTRILPASRPHSGKRDEAALERLSEA